MLESPFNEYVAKIEDLQRYHQWVEETFIRVVKEFLADGRNDGLTFEHIMNSASPEWLDALDRRAEAGEAGLESLWTPETDR